MLHPLEIVSVANENLAEPVGSLTAEGDAITAALDELNCTGQRKVGSAAISSRGTASMGNPALFQARRPPLITATRTPLF